MSQPQQVQSQAQVPPQQVQSQAKLSDDVIASLAKELEGGQSTEPEAVAEQGDPVVAETATAAPVQSEPAVSKPAPLEKSFEKLAQEKAAFRAEQERMKPYMDALQKFDPLTLRALTQAVESKDPSKVLQALNMQSTAQNLNEAEVSRPEIPELAEIKEELSELRRFRAEQKEAEAIQKIKDVTKTHKLISARGAHKMVLEHLLAHVRATGSPPGDTIEESFALAADAVEGYLNQEAESWRKVLTPTQAMVESPQTSPLQVTTPQPMSKTLSNAATSAPPMTVSNPSPKTAEEYQALALEEAKKLFGW